jgi:hypothetical protein
VIAGLTCLGTFQLAEYVICTNTSLFGLNWARLGYMVITILPPIGISLALRLAQKKAPQAELIMYLICICFMFFYGLMPGSIINQTCQGNYVIFQTAPNSGIFYGIYYIGLLILGTTLSRLWATQTPNKNNARALNWLMIGYLIFMIPTGVIALLDAPTRQAIPSVMCGFAIFLALIMLTVVLPIFDKKPQTNKKSQLVAFLAKEFNFPDKQFKDFIRSKLKR